MQKIIRTALFSTFITGLIVASMSGIFGAKTLAASQNTAAAARVSFTFDDGNASAYTQAAPTLKKYGLTGTSYVTTSCVGIVKVPNTCKANENATYMTWAQVTALQNTYGWEVGSHTATHPLLASADVDMGQPAVLTAAQVDAELSQSKAALVAHGINVKSFASPFGDYNPTVLAQIAKYYESHRGYADIGYNQYPYSDYLIRDQEVRVGVSVATVKGYIDQAIANKTWLVLTFHDIKTKPTNGADSYDYSTANLGLIAAYVKSKQTAGLIQPVNVSKGLVTNDTNMLPNSSFNTAIGTDWTTNNVTAITRDTANNGSYPDAANAIKLTANAYAAHISSPNILVDSNTTYLLKNYINVQQLTSGEVSFYIDEYDVNGHWISGQYKAAERAVWADNLNFMYKPSSNLVRTASLQVGIPANSGIVAYYDNAQWFTLGTITPPLQTNLLTNGTFDAGITGGWTTNSPTTILADATSNGSPLNIVNSVKLTSSTIDRHLFSPMVTVTNASAYTITSYLDVQAITSNEVGFYIDEYDVNGNWISGQYKTGIRSVSKGTVGLSYVASSAAVAKASLQVIVPANAGLLAYFDDVVWYKN